MEMLSIPTATLTPADSPAPAPIPTPMAATAAPTPIPSPVSGTRTNKVATIVKPKTAIVNLIDPLYAEIMGLSVGEMACLIQSQQEVHHENFYLTALPNGLLLQAVEDGTLASGSADEGAFVPEISSGRWTKSEHDTFLIGLKLYGKEWKRVSNIVKTRTVVQTRTHAQKYFQKLQKAMAAGDNFVTAMMKSGDEDEPHASSSTKKAKKSSSSSGSAAYSLPRSLAATTTSSISSRSTRKKKSVNRTNQEVDTTPINQSMHKSMHQSVHQSMPLHQSMSSMYQANGGLSAFPANPSDFLLSAGSDDNSRNAQENAADFLSSIKSNKSANRPMSHSGTDRYGRTDSSGAFGGGMQIVAPTPAELRPGFPTPSPAGCGKRKHNELSAAQMLAGVSASQSGTSSTSSNRYSLGNYNFGGSQPHPSLHKQSSSQSTSSATSTTKPNINKDLQIEQQQNRSASLPNHVDIEFMDTPKSSPKLRPQIAPLTLQIINPDILGGETKNKRMVDGEEVESPTTPWENELRDLNNRHSLDPSHLVDTTMSEIDEVGAMFDTNFASPNPTLNYSRSSIGSRSSRSNNSNLSHHRNNSNNSLSNMIPPPPSISTTETPTASATSNNFSRAPHPLDLVLSRSTLHKCVCEGKNEAVKLILNSSENSTTTTTTTTQNSPQHSFINTRDNNEFTPLHSAASLDVVTVGEGTAADIVTQLLNKTADVTMEDSTGCTPLHWAARAGNGDVVHLLTSRNCPLDAQNKDGETALHWALRAGIRGSNSARVLIEDGAKSSIFNKSFRTALDCAAKGFKTFDFPMSPVASVNNQFPSTTERKEARLNLFSCEPRSRTLILHHPECMEHLPRSNGDWECPDRINSILNKLSCGDGMFGSHEVTITTEFEKASLEILARIHSTEYISFVNDLSLSLEKGGIQSAPVPFTPQVQKSILNKNEGEDIIKKGCHSDTSFSAGSLKAARRAAGAVKHAVDRVMIGRNRNAFCLVRPPGHHAGIGGLLEGADSCGFCIFNNLAAGALHALSDHHSCEKVAIIDIDVHHGNGTEDIVRNYSEPHRIFFFSVHLLDEDKTTGYQFYPGTGDKDDTKHNIINVPIAPMWRKTEVAAAIAGEKGGEDVSIGEGEDNFPQHYLQGMGQQAYRMAIQNRLLPALAAFNPDLVMISAGFDAARGDVGNAKHGKREKQGLDLEPEDYAWTTEKIMEIADSCCNGKVVSVLEGGYGQTVPVAVLEARTTRSRSFDGSNMDSEATSTNLNRDMFSESACRHLKALIDPYEKLEI